MTAQQPPVTYAGAGVDIEAGDLAKAQYASLAAMTRRPEVLADVGPFAGLFRLGKYEDPVLVASADGVGTKVKIASVLGRLDSVGHDLVNHCVNDALTSGATPLFFLDYVAGDGVPAETKVDLVRGVAEACKAVGMALLGGETADMPGVYLQGELDLAGFIIGIVERDAVIDGSGIRVGDALIAVPSNGLHTNGYSLARRVFDIGVDGDPVEERQRADERPAELMGDTVGEALLRPHRAYFPYLKPVLPLLRGIAHITGGGLPGNVNRILPDRLAARLDATSWPVPPIFPLIAERGGIEPAEMFRAFNMGAGLVLACRQEDAGDVLAALDGAVEAGEVVVQGDGPKVIVEGMERACARS